MPEPAWLAEARKMIGTVEGAGAKNTPSVVHLYEEASHPEIHQDSVPWCAAFVGAMLKRAGIKPSGSLAARSYESWGQPLKVPLLGAVAVKKRAGGGWVGHVGFVVGSSPTSIILLGGNQGDKVSIAAFNRKDFTAYRWPANLPVPPPSAVPLPTSVKGAQVNPSQG